MHESGAAEFAAATLLIARFCVAAVFLRAGAVKPADPGEFRLAVGNYRILPAGLVAPVAAGLPAVEAAAGLLLLLGVFPGAVAAALAALLGCFCAAVGVNLARGRVFDCGCGAAPRLISRRHVAGSVYSVTIPAGSALPLALAAVRSRNTPVDSSPSGRGGCHASRLGRRGRRPVGRHRRLGGRGARRPAPARPAA